VSDDIVKRYEVITNARVGDQLHTVTADIGASEDADQPVVAVRVVTGIFECLPCAFEEETVLRIHELRFARRITEEARIELVDVI